MLPGNGIAPVFGDVASENQIAYVAVANDMTSCYGGTAPGLPGGCETFALLVKLVSKVARKALRLSIQVQRLHMD